MFVRVKTTPNSPRKSIQIVENSRDVKTGKVKQKIVRYIGIAMDDNEEDKLRALALESLAKLKHNQNKQTDQLSLLPEQTEAEILATLAKAKPGRKPKKSIENVLPVSEVTLDMIEEESRVIDGVHEAAGYLYDELAYNNVLPNARYNNILKDLVLCRISNPSSKLATSKILQRYYMKEHDLDAIYRTMDQVFDRIDAIKKITFSATNNLIAGPVEVILFDVTTLHFESTQTDDLRKFGYSKNFRFNTTQVVLALATNSDGLAIGYELFEGNKAEVKTLVATIDEWKEKFAIGKVCFIGDRAMFSEDNLKELELRNYNYIVAAKLRLLPDLMQKKLLDANNYSSITNTEESFLVGSFTYGEQDLNQIKISAAKTTKYKNAIEQNNGRRFVVSYSNIRANYDSKKRQILIDKISKQLSTTTNSAKLISNAALKKYTSSTGKSDIALDQVKIEEDAKWDGYHGVITNINIDDMQNADILAHYKRLVKIEDCFRVNKTTLKMRPIYHFKPKRIRAHIAICYMAFALIRQIEYRVKLTKKISITSIIEELNSVQSSIYIHKTTKDRYRVPGNFSHDARKIYQAIGVLRNLDATPLL